MRRHTIPAVLIVAMLLAGVAWGGDGEMTFGTITYKVPAGCRLAGEDRQANGSIVTFRGDAASTIVLVVMKNPASFRAVFERAAKKFLGDDELSDPSEVKPLPFDVGHETLAQTFVAKRPKTGFEDYHYLVAINLDADIAVLHLIAHEKDSYKKGCEAINELARVVRIKPEGKADAPAEKTLGRFSFQPPAGWSKFSEDDKCIIYRSADETALFTVLVSKSAMGFKGAFPGLVKGIASKDKIFRQTQIQLAPLKDGTETLRQLFATRSAGGAEQHHYLIDVDLGNDEIAMLLLSADSEKNFDKYTGAGEDSGVMGGILKTLRIESKSKPKEAIRYNPEPAAVLNPEPAVAKDAFAAADAAKKPAAKRYSASIGFYDNSFAFYQNLASHYPKGSKIRATLTPKSVGPDGEKLEVVVLEDKMQSTLNFDNIAPATWTVKAEVVTPDGDVKPLKISRRKNADFGETVEVGPSKEDGKKLDRPFLFLWD